MKYIYDLILKFSRHLPDSLFRIFFLGHSVCFAFKRKLQLSRLIGGIDMSRECAHLREIDYIKRTLTILDLCKNPHICIFPGAFNKKYQAMPTVVGKEDGFCYVNHKGKYLFFRKGYYKVEIERMYRALCMEQDPESPHCYTAPNFNVTPGSILFDVGCAEAMFTLEHIEEIEHAYLFECDSQWMAALEKTFAPWRDKVTIIPKFVADKNEENWTTLDRFMEDSGLSDVHKEFFVKLDIEGCELQALAGARKMMETHSVKMACCLYHRKDDAKDIPAYIETLKPVDGIAYQGGFSDGFMLFNDEFRKGMYRICKRDAFIYE